MSHGPAAPPALAPGERLTPTAWACHSAPNLDDPSGASRTETCDVTGWTVMPALSRVEVFGPADGLPVRESAPMQPGAACPIVGTHVGGTPACVVTLDGASSDLIVGGFTFGLLLLAGLLGAAFRWRH